MIDLQGPTTTPEERELLCHPLIGGVLVGARNCVEPGQLAALVAQLHAVRSPPLIVAADQEGGRGQCLRAGFSVLPSARRIGHELDFEPQAGVRLARAMGWLMAAELRAVGIDTSFAPCVDIAHGVSESIGDRAFHASATSVSALAVAYARGMRDAGMPAVAKHFPGQGAVVADPHLRLPVDRREFADLSGDLTPYRRLIANGLPAVMAGHVLFPEVDATPASLSRRWIRDVLRGELGFQGVVFSDDLCMGAAAAAGDIATRAREALAAGCDMLPVRNDRSGVLALVGSLDIEPEPASRLRLVRLHGRQRMPWEALRSTRHWRRSQELLQRCSAAPTLSLEAGGS